MNPLTPRKPHTVYSQVDKAVGISYDSHPEHPKDWRKAETYTGQGLSYRGQVVRPLKSLRPTLEDEK